MFGLRIAKITYTIQITSPPDNNKLQTHDSSVSFVALDPYIMAIVIVSKLPQYYPTRFREIMETKCQKVTYKNIYSHGLNKSRALDTQTNKYAYNKLGAEI